MNNDDKLKQALDELFDDYDKEKKEEFISHTLLNIPKISITGCEIPDISDTTKRKQATIINYPRKKILYKKLITIGVLIFFLVISLGFPLFNNRISIKGTASTLEAFDVEINCNVVLNSGLVSTGTGQCGVDGTKISMKSDLSAPSEKVYYMVIITNKGDYPIVLKDILSQNNKEANLKDTGDYAYLDESSLLFAKYSFFYDNKEIIGDTQTKRGNITLEPNESVSMIVSHEWLSSDEQPALDNGTATINYDIILKFNQVSL